MTIPELVAACEEAGVVFTGRPSKVVSDTLRWERRKFRVQRVARGRYRFGRMPRSTSWWLDQKVLVLRARLAQLRRDAKAFVGQPAAHTVSDIIRASQRGTVRV